jgi:hypothetical protein
MSQELTNRTVMLKPGLSFQGKTGERLTIIIPPPRCFVDCHSHIENGACAPLPLLWDKLPLRPHIERNWVDGLAKAFKRSTGYLQAKSTTKIGKCAVAAIDEAFGLKSIIGQSDLYKNADLFTCLVIQMMDMEYAQIAGYLGQTIYHEDETPWYYYERVSGVLPENRGKKVLLPGENQKTFSKWWKQFKETIDAVRVNPLKIIPMYHYEPRRWNHSKSTKPDENYQQGSWAYPFDQIATKTNQGLFIGFKVYPSLGYKPLDERLPYMHDKSKEGDCFYGHCEREGIPILSHCSPGGMTTHELPYYFAYEADNHNDSSHSQQSSEHSHAPADATGVAFDGEKIARDYFYSNYVHPKAWRKVLEKFPKLKLCLAHFGGEKQYDHLKDKILFGTDWYMTLVALGGKSYKQFCEEFWAFFKELPGGMDLWMRFTFLNPFDFYGFNDPGIMDNMVAALKKAKCNPNMLNENYSRLRRMQKEYNKQREKLTKSN